MFDDEKPFEYFNRGKNCTKTYRGVLVNSLHKFISRSHVSEC